MEQNIIREMNHSPNKTEKKTCNEQMIMFFPVNHKRHILYTRSYAFARLFLVKSTFLYKNQIKSESSVKLNFSQVFFKKNHMPIHNQTSVHNESERKFVKWLLAESSWRGRRHAPPTLKHAHHRHNHPFHCLQWWLR